MRTESALLASVFAFLVGCGSSSTDSPPGGAGSPGGVDSGAGAEGGGPGPVADGGAGNHDAGGSDAATDADAGGTLVVIQPVSGAPTPTKAPLHGPGVVLMGGGTDVDSAFVWMHDTLAGSASAKMGNLIVLRADVNTDNAYTAYIYGLAPFQSVMTMYLGGTPANGGPATPDDLTRAAGYVDQADAVFFAGGDQADYVSWKGSALTAAIGRLYARGGVVGGTSAGCVIQGPFAFDSVAADAAGNASVTTADAIANPFESTISFTRGMFAFPSLPNVLTDMHFVTRDRTGRLAAFLARQYADGAASGGVIGVGVDESNALLVDKNGLAKLAQQPGGSQAAAGTGAYVFQPAGPADTCQAGKPLVYKNVKVTRLANAATDSFDFTKRCGTGMELTLTVDGSNTAAPYSQNPYTAAGTATKCP